MQREEGSPSAGDRSWAGTRVVTVKNKSLELMSGQGKKQVLRVAAIKGKEAHHGSKSHREDTVLSRNAQNFMPHLGDRKILSSRSPSILRNS